MTLDYSRQLRAANSLFSADGDQDCRPRAAALQSGQWIDQYQLIRPVGDGGMGEIWLAQQETPIKRKVAIKLVRREKMSDRACRRFMQERQTLAMLNHPCICGILDAGTREDGTPYLVMHWLDALPITEYCDQNQLGISERLELFCEVCDAIQYAHDQGILHRDIKPGNILVCEFAGKPVVQVIDFGLSKVTGVEPLHGLRSDLTYDGEVIGTLRYMSPEHASRGNEGITVQSEVYSLGVVLYELLVGRTPKSPDRSDSLDEFLNHLRSSESTRPSQLLGTDKEILAKVLEDRKANAEALMQTLKLDLDWVVIKALHRLPRQRYKSVSEMGDEIRLYLAGQPVSCRLSELGYRIRKVAQKHCGLFCVVAASILFTLLSVALGVYLTRPAAITATPMIAEVRFEISDLASGMTRDTAELEKLFLAKTLASADLKDCCLDDCESNRERLLNSALPRLAARFSKAACEKSESEFGKSALRTLTNRRSDALILSTLGRYMESKQHLERLVADVDKESQLGIQLQFDLAKIEEDSGELQPALHRLQGLEAKIMAAKPNANQLELGQRIARLHWKLGQTQQALEIARQNIEIADLILEPATPEYHGVLIDLQMYQWADKTTEPHLEQLLACFGKDQFADAHLALADLDRLETLTQIIPSTRDNRLSLTISRLLHDFRMSIEPGGKRLLLIGQMYLMDKSVEARALTWDSAYMRYCRRDLASIDEAVFWSSILERWRQQPNWSEHKTEILEKLTQQREKLVDKFSEDNPAAIALKLHILQCESASSIDPATIELLHDQVLAVSGADHPVAKRLESMRQVKQSYASTWN